MRVVSFLPSATDILFALGLDDHLVGVSDDCNWPEAVRALPLVARTRIDASALSAAQIEAIVGASEAESHSLYTVDAALMDQLAPDLIITQDLCTVCAVSSDDLTGACPIGTTVYSMNPRRLEDVVDSVAELAERLGEARRGVELAGQMRAQIDATRQAVADLPAPRVFVAEWMDPPYGSGHWLPDMVEAAGGENLLSAPGAYSFATSWSDVLAAEPDVIVIAACGFDLEQAMSHLDGLRLPVRSVVVDGDAYYSRPGPRVVDGVRQLAHLLHPEAVADPGLAAVELPLGEPVA
jgi:iron complex transport system substrate-binding protein